MFSAGARKRAGSSRVVAGGVVVYANKERAVGIANGPSRYGRARDLSSLLLLELAWRPDDLFLVLLTLFIGAKHEFGVRR